jgi:hypothetical protein
MTTTTSVPSFLPALAGRLPDIVTGTGKAEALEMPPEGVVELELAILLAYR